MIYSPTKTEDQKYILELVETIELLLPFADEQSDLIVSLNNEIERVEHKVQTHDYSQEDNRYYFLQKIT